MKLRQAAKTGIWLETTTWEGNKLPVSGDSIVIPAGVTVTLTNTCKPTKTDCYFYISEASTKPTKLTVNGTLLLEDDVNFFLYGVKGSKPLISSVITVNQGGVIKGGNNGTHLKIGYGDGNGQIELYEGGKDPDPHNPKGKAHPIAVGDSIPMITGPTSCTIEGCFSINPLPITLVSFKATYQPAESRVKLEWLTSQEINNDYFAIERSRDARNFSEIARIPGAGNSSERMAYEYYDSQPLAGIAYYRLRQTDYDGQNTLSKIVSVTTDGAFSWRVSPNPSNGNINLVTNGEAENLDVRVFSSIGKLLYQGAEAGRLPVSLSAGMYYVRVSKDGQASTQKVIVQ